MMHFSNSSLIENICSTSSGIDLLIALLYELLTILGYACFYFPIIFAPIGIILNIVIIIIFSKFSLETKDTTRIYYTFIAISELGTLIFKDIWFGIFGIGWSFIFNGQNLIGLLDSSSLSSPNWMCPMNVFLWYFFEIIANNIFVILDLERLLAVYFPFKTRAIFTQARALIAITILTLLSGLVSATSIPLVSVQEIGFLALCSAGNTSPLWSNLGVVRIAINYISPPIFILICSILILIKIIKRRNPLLHGKSSSTLMSRDISVIKCSS